MINYLKPKPETFGLDISDFSIKAAKVKGSSLHSFASMTIDAGVVVKGKVEDEPRFVSAITSLIERLKPGTRYVSIALPEERSFLKVIRMPRMDERDLEGAVTYEAENHLPLPADEVYLDFEVIGPIGDDIEILLAAIPREVADSCVSALSTAGLFALSMETESLAIVRSLIGTGMSREPVLIVDIGEGKVSFTIFSGGAIRFTGSVQISSDSLERSEEIEKDFRYVANGSMTEELALAIRRHLEYYRSRVVHEVGFEKISAVIICGGTAAIPGLSEKLSSMTDSVVKVADPFLNLSKRPKGLSVEEGLRYGVAIGSALRPSI